MAQVETHIENDQKNLDFWVLQYNTLRQEILDIRKRIVPMLGIGLAGIPLFIAAGWEYQLKPVIIASPLVTVAFIFMLLFEQKSLIRAGRYIRLHIEPVLVQAGLVGWERFLETEPKNRRAERLFFYAALLIFSIYYIIGTIKSTLLVKSMAPLFVPTVVTLVYAVIFLIVIRVVVENFKVRTKHPFEPIDPTQPKTPRDYSIDHYPQVLQSKNVAQPQDFSS